MVDYTRQSNTNGRYGGLFLIGNVDASGSGALPDQTRGAFGLDYRAHSIYGLYKSLLELDEPLSDEEEVGDAGRGKRGSGESGGGPVSYSTLDLLLEQSRFAPAKGILGVNDSMKGDEREKAAAKADVKDSSSKTSKAVAASATGAAGNSKGPAAPGMFGRFAGATKAAMERGVTAVRAYTNSIHTARAELARVMYLSGDSGGMGGLGGERNAKLSPTMYPVRPVPPLVG